jgi:hypothetical protein
MGLTGAPQEKFNAAARERAMMSERLKIVYLASLFVLRGVPHARAEVVEDVTEPTPPRGRPRSRNS